MGRSNAVDDPMMSGDAIGSLARTSGAARAVSGDGGGAGRAVVVAGAPATGGRVGAVSSGRRVHAEMSSAPAVARSEMRNATLLSNTVTVTSHPADTVQIFESHEHAASLWSGGGLEHPRVRELVDHSRGAPVAHPQSTLQE